QQLQAIDNRLEPTMQEPVDDFTQKQGVEHFLSRYAFLAPLNAYAAAYNEPATDYHPPEPTYSPAWSYLHEPQTFPTSGPLKTKIKLQKADKKKISKDSSRMELTHLKQQCEDVKKDKKKQLKSYEQLHAQLLQAEKDHAQTKSALEAATDKKNVDLERQRQEDCRDSHLKIIQAEMRGTARLEQAKKDKQHLERVIITYPYNPFDTKTELLAGAEMYSDLEKKHKSCAVTISDFKRRLQSAVDKTSGLEKQLQESREETARLKSELQEREATFGKKTGRFQETFQNYTQAEKQEVPDATEESARLGSQLRKSRQDHSQCASYARELKDVTDQLGSRLDQTEAALERKCTMPGDIPVAGSDWKDYSLHDAKQAYHRLEMVNDDLKKQLAEIETYIESFLRKTQKGTGTKS
ncbi:hypothetical protein BGZ52_004370, partial [Haplosporangium bisporale]